MADQHDTFQDQIVVSNNAEVRPYLSVEDNAENQLADVAAIILAYGGIDGAHHKAWVLDQIIRRLTNDKYEEFVKFARGDFDKEYGDYEYEWDTGIAP